MQLICNGTFVVQTKEKAGWKGGVICKVDGSDLFFGLWVVKYKRVTLGAFANEDTLKGLVLEFLLFHFAIFQFADICYGKHWEKQSWVRLLAVGEFERCG
eukprot:3992102-Ditylum_brightwellii.AAC.1